MPCDSIITHSVVLTNVAESRVQAALIALGIHGTVSNFTYLGYRWSLRRGVLSVQGSRYASQDLKRLAGEVADTIRRTVSVQAVQEAAAANGWEFSMDLSMQDITLTRQAGGF